VVTVIISLVVAEIVSTTLWFSHERAARRSEEERLLRSEVPDVWWRGNLSAAIRRPPTVGAREAAIRPDEEVIGVLVGGKARAYRLGAFREPRGHLVNDLLGGTAVSVAYCNLTDCVRAYTNPAASAPLDIEVAGLLNGEMVIKIEGKYYLQKSGLPVEPRAASVAPYESITPIRTTHEEWVRDHPETDVYIGDRREFASTELR
jgi:Protein of unknown function (DUF3179)